MTCCPPGSVIEGAGLPTEDEIRLVSRDLGNGSRQVDLSVPAVHCAACIQTVEKALARLPEVEAARVNLSSHRVSVRWAGNAVPAIVPTLAALGYAPNLFSSDAEGKDGTLAELLRAVAVSGFAAGNIMLLSVSVWSGAEGATRDLFHWISALIALPALAFAGRIYYRSAWSALSHGRMNMDVPIAIGVSLAYAMSLYETVTHGPHAYFDASVTLLFFLLIGRTLDHVMRDRARAAVIGLARLSPRGATVIEADGTRSYRPVDEIAPGTRLLVAAGERIPVDANVIDGQSDIDASIITGESRPAPVTAGDTVRAGMLNLTGPLTLSALAAASGSFLAEMMRMMEAAEGGRARYRRIAERVAALYAPVVHLTALVTFLAWLALGAGWHQAMTIAIAVLIITCPCALGLAVPIVQVMAARRLFENGIMVKDGSAMERLAEADVVVADKTGTLTFGQPRLADTSAIDPRLLRIAAELGAHSRHPYSRAIAAHGVAPGELAFERVSEHPGLGIEGSHDGSAWRLGRGSWATGGRTQGTAGAVTTLARDGQPVATFAFVDPPRADAREALAELSRTVGPVEMLSGDNPAACAATAAAIGLEKVSASLLPADKVARIEELTLAGHKVLMTGDGLNDAPALAAAHVSFAPSSAADVGRNAADFVFLRDSLLAVPVAVAVSRQAGRLIRQNLAIAIVYNAVAVPIAILGHVTPLVAAIAMSLSSLLVIGNALRLGSVRPMLQGRPSSPATPAVVPALQ